MIGELLLFCACLVSGGVLRGVYFLMRLVCRRTNLLLVSITFDVLYGVAFFLPLFTLALFFNDGMITFYMAAGQVIGFFLLKLLF